MGGIPVVLVIEDDWILRDCIAAHLRASQLRVLEARTGEIGLSLLEAGNQVDVLFTDIQLGTGVNGWEVGARFRRTLPLIPIIYTSGKKFRADACSSEEFVFREAV